MRRAFCALSLLLSLSLAAVTAVPTQRFVETEETTSAAALPLSYLCPECKTLANTLLHTVEANSTLEKERQVLDKICALIPEKMRTDCLHLVDTVVSFTADTASGTLAKYTPFMLCSAAQICQNDCCETPNTPEQIHITTTGISTEMAVSWVTLDAVESVIQFDSNFESCCTDDNSVNFRFNATGVRSTYTSGGWLGYLHTVLLTDLEPGTQYWYRVGDPHAQNLWRHYSWNVDILHFRTPRLPSSDLTVKFGVVGDMGATSASDPTVARLTEMRLDDELDFVFHVGDISYADGYAPLWDMFMRKVSQVAAYVPYIVVPGNHEDFFDFKPYLARFAAMPGPQSGSDTPLYYSYNYGPVHVIAFNTEMPLNMKTDFRPGQAQYDWLKADLETANQHRDEQPWIVAFGHRPLACTSKKQNICGSQAASLRTHLETLFNEQHVNVVVGGHVHEYERTFPVSHVSDGIFSRSYDSPAAPVYLTNGASGTKEQLMGGYVDPLPGWSAFRKPAYGFGVFTANTTHLQWEYIEDTTGVVIDSVVLSQ